MVAITAGGVNSAAADTLDEGIVYVYDSTKYPFYLAVRQRHAYALRVRNVTAFEATSLLGGPTPRNVM